MRHAASSSPILIALIDDYDVVLTGVARCSTPTATASSSPRSMQTSRSRTPSTSRCTTRSPNLRPIASDIDVLIHSPHAHRVVVYTWNFHPDLIEHARRHGAHGYLSKTLPARDLVTALEAVHAGETVISDPPRRARAAARAGLAGPGRRPHRPRVRDPRADHSGQEQRRRRRADLPQPQHDQVLHPDDLPQDRCRQPNPSRALGRQARVHSRPRPHRPLARRTMRASAPKDVAEVHPCGRCAAR